LLNALKEVSIIASSINSILALVQRLGCLSRWRLGMELGNWSVETKYKHYFFSVKSGSASVCFLNATSIQDNDCSDKSNPTSMYYLFFIFSQLLAGAGTTPLFSLGPAYIDENVHPKKTSWYLGVFYLSFFLGPSIGSMLGGKLLSIHVDLVMVNKILPCSSLTPFLD
jgi:MFS family permease